MYSFVQGLYTGLGIGYTTVQFCTGFIQWVGHRVYHSAILYRAYTMNWALGTG
jgi:hypothetical protein